MPTVGPRPCFSEPVRGRGHTSCQAEKDLSILNRTLENLRSGMAVDKVDQLTLPRLNKQLIMPEIASLPFVTRKLKSMHVPRYGTDKVNTREAAAAVTASERSPAPT